MAFMTKADFKDRWEADDEGGSITFDDIADCAQEWGLFRLPRTRPMKLVAAAVLAAAGVAGGGS